ncbi:tetratricopeptide repeat protein [Calycomorphotria hydatis]|nr:tetratricopeptide repeat protein [Calycomorphotria hydatis]
MNRSLANWGICCLTLAILLCTTAVSFAQAPAAPQPDSDSSESKAAEKNPGLESNNQFDQPALPHQPEAPLTDRERAASEALSWYAAGRVHEARNEFQQAMRAYRKAVDLNPNEVKFYRSLVPLAFSLNQADVGLQYALKLVELDPNDFRLLRQLGTLMVTRNQIPRAIELLEKASVIDGINKRSAPYIVLQRDLGVLYGSVGKVDQASTSFAIVLDALLRPAEFPLDLPTRAALLADAEATYERMGDVFFQAGDHDRAIQAYEEADRARRGKPGILKYNLARIYSKTEKPEKALEQLDAYIEKGSTESGRDAYQLLASVLESLDRKEEYRSRLEAILEETPRNSAAALELANLYVEQEQYDEAEKLYKEIIDRKPSQDAYLGLAAIHRSREDAAALLDTLVLATKNANDLSSLEKEFAAVQENEAVLEQLISLGRDSISDEEGEPLPFRKLYILAKFARAVEREEDAIIFYEATIEQADEKRLQLLEELGEYQIGLDRYADAAKTFRVALNEAEAAGGVRAHLLYELSQALEMDGQTDAAIEAIEDASRIIPNNSLLDFQRAWINSHAKRYDKAIELYQEVIDEHPESPAVVRQARFALSNVYVQSGDATQGIAVLEKIYEEDPDDVSVNNDLGYLLADEGVQLERAEQMIRKALDGDPENAAYLDSMGWVLYRLERYEEAAKYLERAVTKPEGQDAVLYEHLGDVHQKLNNVEDARKAWTTAVTNAEKSSRPNPELIKTVKGKLEALPPSKETPSADQDSASLNPADSSE